MYLSSFGVNQKLFVYLVLLEMKESMKVLELRKIVCGILQKDVEDIKLLKNNKVNCAHSNSGYTTFTIKIILGATVTSSTTCLQTLQYTLIQYCTRTNYKT